MEPGAALVGNGVAGSLSQPVVCPVLVGRATTLDVLAGLVDRVAGGAGGMAVIAGEAGIGKSRLVAEARARAAGRELLVLEGDCFPQDRACPYAPLLDVLRGCFAGQLPEAVVAAAGPFGNELSALLPELMPRPDGPLPAGAGPEQERRRLFDGLAHCLLDRSARQPLLIVVEDLHWCDDASLDFLLHVRRRATRAPIGLLATYREEDADPSLRRWLGQLDRERLAVELHLGPLARDEVAAMLRAIFGDGRQVPAELLDAVWALSEGNPLYVEELLKGLVEAGTEPRGEGRRARVDGPAAWRIPRSLRAAVQERVARLSPAAREVLTLATVVGRDFDFELLERLAQVDERALLAIVKELIAAQLVTEESRDRFAFRHTLIREVVYAELLERERVALHRTVAEAAEQVWAEGPARHLDDLAYHFYQAGAWEKALAYGRRAGERARRLYAPRAAVTQLTRALDAAGHLARSGGGRSEGAPPPDAHALAEMHRERGQAYETLGDFEHALADYELCTELARATGDRRAEWQALLDLGTLWTSRDYGRAGACFEQALELARALDLPALVGRSLDRLGNWRVNTAQPREALPLHREALSIFEELGDRPAIAESLDLLGIASYLSADLPGSMACYERAVALFRQLDDRPGLVSSLAMLATRGGGFELGSMTSDAAMVAAGVRDGEQAVRLAREIDWRAGEAFARLQLATVLVVPGDYAPALNAARTALRIAEEIEHTQWQAGAHCTLGQVYLDLLALPTARRHLERALQLAREIRSTFWVQMATGCLAWAYVLGRDFARADGVLGPLPELERPVQSLGERWVSFGHLQLAIARRDWSLALRLVDRATAPALDGSPRFETPRPALARGEVMTGLGRYAEAETALRGALDVVDRQGARPLGWRVHAALGHLYRAQERSEEAQHEFSAARVILEELASGLPDAELRDELLQTATAGLPRQYRLSPRRVEAARHGGLTAREREVAALVARGKSNREIADALVLGERTVETHVGHVLAKLGLASRREIARWAAETGLPTAVE